ncbi:LPXTG cell wall anchor domain-containing protein [Clostridiales bacterium]|nr:LPXTG cell wall anchor domain-containing protein [Clostridiales bacterium]
MRFPPPAVIGRFPTIFYIVGGILLVGAAIVLVARRKANN